VCFPFNRYGSTAGAAKSLVDSALNPSTTPMAEEFAMASQEMLGTVMA
jgi:hypothetical protein